jgi:hypothetical protein
MFSTALILAITVGPALPTEAGQRPEQSRSFSKVKFLPAAETSETESMLVFDEDQLILRSARDGLTIGVISFTRIRNARYAMSRTPPWEPGRGQPNVFSASNKHWLAVEGENGTFGLIILDVGNYRAVMQAFETRTGVKVEVVRTGND